MSLLIRCSKCLSKFAAGTTHVCHPDNAPVIDMAPPMPSEKPHTFKQGGGGLCAICGYNIISSLHTLYSEPESPSALIERIAMKIALDINNVHPFGKPCVVEMAHIAIAALREYEEERSKNGR